MVSPPGNQLRAAGCPCLFLGLAPTGSFVLGSLLSFITSEESSAGNPKVSLYPRTVMALPLTLPLLTWASGSLRADIGAREDVWKASVVL